jgi:hypothetical protein
MNLLAAAVLRASAIGCRHICDFKTNVDRVLTYNCGRFGISTDAQEVSRVCLVISQGYPAPSRACRRLGGSAILHTYLILPNQVWQKTRWIQQRTSASGFRVVFENDGGDVRIYGGHPCYELTFPLSSYGPWKIQTNSRWHI